MIIDLYRHEEESAIEKRKTAETQFTKDVFLTLLKVKKTQLEINNIINLFFEALSLNKAEWLSSKVKKFCVYFLIKYSCQNSAKNFGLLKQTMMNFQSDNLNEDMTQKSMTYWKNYHTLQPVFKKANKGASKILDWITSIVEHKLKKETISSLKRRFVEVKTIQFQQELSSISFKNKSILISKIFQILKTA